MHHSQEMDDFISKKLSEMLDLGATGRFPEGRLTPEDEGELRMGVTTEREKIILAFGKPVAWIGFSVEQARKVANALYDRANEVAKQRGERPQRRRRR